MPKAKVAGSIPVIRSNASGPPSETTHGVGMEITYVCERSWHTITAHLDGVKVGSLELDFTDDGEWQVVDVVVSEGFRRRGIASAMYRFANDHVTAGAPIAHRGDSMSPDAKGLFAALAADDPSAHRYASAA